MTVTRWLLNHPSRLSWILVELFGRHLPWRRRVLNAWWQLRHFGDEEAFDALWQTWKREFAKPAGAEEGEKA